MMTTALAISLVAIALGFFVYLQNMKPKAAPVLHPLEFKPFKLVKITKVSHNTNIYRLELPHPEAVLGLPTGQHVSVRAIIDGKEIVRSYTPVAHAKGWFDLLIKAYPKGNISRYMTTLKVGDFVDVRGPKGAFVYTPGLVKHFNMIAGGTGITPMLQIIEAIVSDPDDKTTVTLLFGNVNEEDILLRKELNKLSEDPRVTVVHVLNNPPEKWDGHQGFVTKDLIRATCQPPSDDSKMLLCGPPPMIKAVKDAAVELGWKKARALSKLEDQVFAF